MGVLVDLSFFRCSIMGDVDDFAASMKDMLGDLKEWEKASRPPPTPEREAIAGSKFKGIITLADQGVATELSRAIGAVIENSVEIFRAPAKIKRLQLDVQRMVALTTTFPPWCVDQQLQSTAHAQVQQLQQHERALNGALARHEPGTMLKGDLGKAVAYEIKTLLNGMVEVARLMEIQQKKLVFLACEKARQITTIVGRTSHDHNLDEKFRLLRLHSDALNQLCKQRLAVLEEVGYRSDLEQRLSRAMHNLMSGRDMLIETTQQRIRNPSDVDPQQAQKAQMIDTIAEIERIAEAMAPKQESSFDFDEKMREQLAALKHA